MLKTAKNCKMYIQEEIHNHTPFIAMITILGHQRAIFKICININKVVT